MEPKNSWQEALGLMYTGGWWPCDYQRLHMLYIYKVRAPIVFEPYTGFKLLLNQYRLCSWVQATSTFLQIENMY